MNNTAKQLDTYTQQERKQSVSTHSTKAPKVKKGITPGEGILLVLFLLFFGYMGTTIISTSAAVYETNASIQKTESDIQLQQKENTDLRIEVSELSSYERIWEKAKANGLEINEDNVKVVEQP